jgi:hypothetical protein
MSARIIQLAEFRASRGVPPHSATQLPVDPPAWVDVAAPAVGEPRFHFWSGASGQRYVHTIYSLLECPELPAGNFVLVCRTSTGRRLAMSVGRTTQLCTSLNLAEVRQRAAAIGANEVHVHLLAETAHQSKLIEFDLRAGQLCSPSADPAAVSMVH